MRAAPVAGHLSGVHFAPGNLGRIQLHLYNRDTGISRLLQLQTDDPETVITIGGVQIGGVSLLTWLANERHPPYVSCYGEKLPHVSLVLEAHFVAEPKPQPIQEDETLEVDTDFMEKDTA